MPTYVTFYHGALNDHYEEQANRQGFTLGDEAEYFADIKNAYDMLFVYGFLTDSQADAVCKKIQKNLMKSLKRLPNGGETKCV